jgi:transcriptional regulator with XRE-family HTH domain
MRLRKIRERREMTQETLAKKAGVSRAYLSRLEMGRHDPPLSRLRKLAKVLGVPLTELLG